VVAFGLVPVLVFFLAGQAFFPFRGAEAFFFFAVGLGPATADLARADFFTAMIQPPYPLERRNRDLLCRGRVGDDNPSDARKQLPITAWVQTPAMPAWIRAVAQG